MNKKLKIVSSLALAGMLVTSSFGAGKVFADSTSDYITNPVGIYNKLVQGKTVIPYVLDNKWDSLTVNDIMESDLNVRTIKNAKGETVENKDDLVGTGSVIKTTDGKEYTVVLYGDVNGDGKVNSNDALLVEKSIVDMAELNDVQKVAGDVSSSENNNHKRDGKVNSNDSLAIKKFSAEISSTVITDLPAKEEEEVNYNYTFSIKDAQYVNSENESAIILKVDLDEVLTEDTKFSLIFSGNKDGEPYEITDKTIKIEKNLVSKEKKNPIDLSGFDDGIITLTMKELDEEGNVIDNVVGKYTMVKNAVEPAAANVNTNRTGTRTATLSLEKCGESGITKVKYVVKRLTDPAEAAPTKVEDLTNTINASNGKVENVQVADNLDTKVAYTVYYVLENEYGSQSGIKSVVIASDDNSVKAEEALKEVVAPDLTKEDATTAVFSWGEDENYDSSKTYIATLYKDGEPIYVEEINGSETTPEFTAKMNENGKYKVSVVVKGNAEGTSTNSTATESEEVTVSTLAAVSDVKIENTDDGIILSWNNPNGKEEFKEYAISLYSIDAEGNEVSVKDNITCENDQNKVMLDGILPNTIYVAKVKVIALDGIETLDSEEVTSNQFYVVEEPTVSNAKKGTNSITFTIKPIAIPNKTVDYKVEVYNVISENDPPVYEYKYNTTKEVTANRDNEITIDGLNASSAYAFRLIAIVDGNEVKSDYSLEIWTLPEINNITVGTVEDAKKENSAKIAADDTTLYINGVEYTDPELDAARKIVENLKPGDVVTISDNASNVEIILSGAADQEGSEREFTDLDESSVVLENNGYSKTISGSFKTLTLKGNVYNLADDVTADEIILTDGVDVTGNKAYTIESGATVTINGVEINASNEMKLSASGKNITVDVKGSSSNDAEFTFENTTTDDVTITFDGDETLTAQQLGTIKITSVGGKVTVLSSNVSVKADIKVEVNKGTVDITEPALTGDKEVSVSADKDNKATVVAVSKTDAPDKLINYCAKVEGGTIDLKDYSNEDMKDMFKSDADISLTDDDVTKIDDYISSFGLNGTGATLNVKEGNVVTITLTSSVDKIENIK